MSLLPDQIQPPGVSIGQVNEAGEVIPATNFWLFLYNIWLNTLGSGIPADQLIALESVDLDASGADTSALRLPLSAALVQAMQPSDVVVSPNDLPDIQRALLLAQDGLLQDPQPRAQPAQSVAPTGSPFTYTAAFDGTIVVTGGTVSAIALIRQGTSVATGITTGLIPLSRLDQVQVTYSAGPTMTFLPR